MLGETTVCQAPPARETPLPTTTPVMPIWTSSQAAAGVTGDHYADRSPSLVIRVRLRPDRPRGCPQGFAAAAQACPM
jgi:hypothetical protein